jgi:cytochrome c-type biogenesis protein
MVAPTYSIVWALAAGLASFLSPCVFVLIPAFLAYLGGVDYSEATHTRGFNARIFLNTLAYVLGFTSVFTLLGVILNTALRGIGYMAQVWLARVGGTLIIIFGLFLIGVLKIPWLEAEHRVHVKRKAGYVTSFLFGMTFAVGWTPCVGAVLGSIFTLAATHPGSATTLLFTYSVGLSLPFLFVGVFYAQAAQWIRATAKYTRIISLVFGILLIAVGILLLLGKLSLIASFPVITGPVTP